MDRFQSDPFYLRVYGDYALFTDPMTKGGGEKFTYQVPTAQALRGIVDANYWKPTLINVIDAVKVMKPIQTETQGFRAPLGKGGNDLNYFTYLRDVEYLVKFHFEWNLLREDLAPDRNPVKHSQIILRSMERGGRHDVFLGARECIGYIERLKEREYKAAKTPFEGQQVSYGLMFHSFSYPGDIRFEKDGNRLRSNFANIIMKDGEITFIRPEDCEIQHILSPYHIREFSLADMTSVEDECLDYEKMEVMTDERS